MSEPDQSLSPRKLTGRAAANGAALEVRFEASIQGVDDLIDGRETQDYIAPGFIDLQVNGFAGVDYNDPNAQASAIAESIRNIFATGVTRFLPTIITGSEERMKGSLRNMAKAKAEFERAGMAEGQAMEGFHVEGPHISPESGPRGAHPLEHIRPPDLEEFKRWQDAASGLIRLVTVSPEWEQAPRYIAELYRSGVVASIGHTKATSDQIKAAVDAGATMSTHLGNAAHSTLAEDQQLHMGSACRRPAQRLLHCRRDPHPRRIRTRRSASKGPGAKCAGDGCGHAGDVQTRTVQAGSSGCRAA